MKILFSLLLSGCVFSTQAQQTISNLNHQKDVSSNPKKFIKVGKNIFFTATTPEHGRELWVTEGTTESTKLVKDIMIGENSSLSIENSIDDTFSINDFLLNVAISGNNKFCFTASDNPNEPPKVWETDGTDSGTKKIRNEVRGQLHYTGDEIIEYSLKQEDNQLKIFHKDPNKNVTLELGAPSNSNYRKVVKRGDILFIIQDIFSKKKVLIVDLKEGIFLGKFSSDYFGDLTFSEIWNNEEIYFTKSGTNTQNNKYASELWRFNIKTSKQDSLLSINDGRVSMVITPKEFFVFFRFDGTYSIKNIGGLPFKVLSLNGCYATRYQYDLYDDILYAYQEEDMGGGANVKSFRISDKTIIKNLSFRTTSISQILSPSKIVTRFENKEVVFDIKTEKYTDLLNQNTYNQLFIDQEKSLTFLSSYTIKDKIPDTELYIFDHKKEIFKILKNINTIGINIPQFYTVPFENKQIFVYNHEEGIMLGVTDGTKNGTRDLQLLVRCENSELLGQVSFVEYNQRLGILFNTRKQYNGLVDSVYCFSLDRKLSECILISKRLKTEFGYSYLHNGYGGSSFGRIGEKWFEVDDTDYDNIITDFTHENTIVFNKESNVLLEKDNQFILKEYNRNSSERYLSTYNHTSKKYYIIPNSKNYLALRIFEDKIFYRAKSNNIWYVVADNIVTELIDFKDFAKIVKLKNETYFATFDNIYNSIQGLYKTYFYIYRLNNNKPQLLVTDSSISRSGINEYELDFSEIVIKGTKYLFSRGAFDEVSNKTLCKIYGINSDGSLQKVNDFTFTQNDKWYQILKDGILLIENTNSKIALSVLQEDFTFKKTFQLADNEYITPVENTKMNFRRFYFSNLGNLFVTDGSIEGSKKLINVKQKYVTSNGLFSFQKILNSEETNFYFSTSPTTLWKTDGTDMGTVQLTIDTSSKVNYLNNQNLILGTLGNTLIFKKPNFITGFFEIWYTDGIVQNTRKLLDSQGNAIIYPIRNSEWINPFTTINNKFYFSRQTEINGYEPWVTDGTSEGTKMVGDLVKGIQGSNPYQFVEINQTPYCIATEENKSLQLWSFCNPKVSIDVEKIAPIYTEEVKLFATPNNEWKYQWLKYGESIDNANATNYRANNSGTYQIRVEDKIGCTNISDSIVIKFAQKVLANEEFTDEFNLKIFPNPSLNDLNLTFEGKNEDSFQLSIFDLSGRQLSNQEVQSNVTNTISVQNFNAGAYFIRLTNGEKQSIRKVIKD
jgi:ELWxxDGT repeat protein